jgi:hypothetical protein
VDRDPDALHRGAGRRRGRLHDVEGSDKPALPSHLSPCSLWTHPPRRVRSCLLRLAKLGYLYSKPSCGRTAKCVNMPHTYACLNILLTP